jgi:hypothetical protein
MHPLISTRIEKLPPGALQETMRRVFTDLARLLGYLDSVESSLRDGAQPSDVLHILTSVHGEALMFLNIVEECLGQADGEDKLSESLDSTIFAIRHELKRVYRKEVFGVDSTALHAKMIEACDALRNCFQQSTIVLARVLDPALNGTELFEGLQTRREQSLLLWGDLLAILQAVREAQQESDVQSIISLALRLNEFQDRSMRHLMHRDWESFVTFADGVMALRNLDGAQPLLHQFECYLEVLLSSVRMRSVLVEG